MKISKNLSAKYYQENKERLQKTLVKDIKIFLKKKKKKAKISQKMKIKYLLSIKKYYRTRVKCFIIIPRKYFNLEDFTSS